MSKIFFQREEEDFRSQFRGQMFDEAEKKLSLTTNLNFFGIEHLEHRN